MIPNENQLSNCLADFLSDNIPEFIITREAADPGRTSNRYTPFYNSRRGRSVFQKNSSAASRARARCSSHVLDAVREENAAVVV